MKKLYFKIRGQEPDIECIDACPFESKPSDNTMIGSAHCQQCASCYGFDHEEHWVKCLDHAIQTRKTKKLIDWNELYSVINIFSIVCIADIIIFISIPYSFLHLSIENKDALDIWAMAINLALCFVIGMTHLIKLVIIFKNKKKQR